MKKTEHRKWLEKTAREADRLKLKALRERVREARTLRRIVARETKHACKTAREAVRTYAREEQTRIRRARVLLRAEVARLKTEAEGTCSRGSARRAELREELAAKRAELASLTDDRRREKLWAGKASTLTGRERREESDAEVIANLDDRERVIFDAIKAKLKPTGRMTRTEAFHHWVHDHSQDVARILERHYDREIAELVRDEERHYREMQRGYAKLGDGELGTRVVDSLATRPPRK